MRIGIVAESFLPNVNGVSNSILRILEHIEGTHEAIVIAPGAREFQEEIASYAGAQIVRVPTIRMPLINSLPIGVPVPAVTHALRSFAPDVIHLASPFVLGGYASFSARQLGIPAVAVYQTDVAGFATTYHLTPLAVAAWDWTRIIHNQAARTLAPSSATIAELQEHGVQRVHRWGRGVDAELFHPRRRDTTLRAEWLSHRPGARYVVGFVGRLAAEKGVQRLQALAHREDVQLVIVGDGPERAALGAHLPQAIFTGALSGTALARAYASMDVFVHPGEFETFCQTIQEAQASGVPTIAPRAGGPIDLITDGYNGYLLDVDGFSNQLEQAVDRCLMHLPTLRDDARRSVEPRTWAAVVDQLLEHYEQAIHSPARR
ncbi:GDP-mannose-dependent alpha-mannosyltransferase [Corynebacterium ciconiae DSM 44920]|uniref:glycosyltransferase family 4 protein n=1 Tax=Corynebacterium ciconiae TaxID=227319 RepID=UPI0003829D9D|nr:glycosyltransferase family 1 protein [Corynebacterium ciconiae]WKD60274.1 GDP-mannose-dependent alpha-mannosyltransferase [Corynebacterium ciconiae DSM 44920]